jgi:ABC-type antimicrobial peptide transport system permease subunit
MTRGQVRKMILGQATLMATIGLAPGVFAGMAVAYLLTLSTRLISGHPVVFEIHPVLLASCFALAFAIVLLAAWFPARRATRLNLA